MAPLALSADNFALPQTLAMPVQASASGSNFDRSDETTLRLALATIKADRLAAKDSDPKVAQPARRRILAMASYLIGFFDSRGIVAESAVEPGFDGLFGADTRPDLDNAIDDLLANLEKMLSLGATRDINWTHVAGAVLEGLAMVIVAVVSLAV